MKANRQTKILELIAEKHIETQEQLLNELNACGFRSTQATVSRDIKELRIIKTLDGLGGYHYSAPQTHDVNRFDSRFRVIFRECVTNIDYAQNIIVIHTLPGLANAAASALDAMNMNVVLGTLAGDDTAVVIMRDTNAAAAFCGEIKSLIGG